MSENELRPTWPRGMYGAPQDMYGVSIVLPLVAKLERVTAERDAARAVIAAYKAAGEDVKQACPECEGEGTILVSFAYGGVEIECMDCSATGVTKRTTTNGAGA